MAIKILHAADFHLDTSFDALPEEKARAMRQEARELLMALVERANAERVQVVLLAGDLFDSGVAYWETRETLETMLSTLKARVFIAPGNHDYYSPSSPWASMRLGENVTLFTSPQIRCVELPELGCRVYGAGFTSPVSDRLMSGFRAGRSGQIEMMVMHGFVGGERFNAIREADIAASGLNYLALGHVHSFGGLRQAGKTTYAYAGCLMGRGFDETGEKGFLLGTVGRDGCDLDFVPLARRQYRVVKADLTGQAPMEAVKAALRPLPASDIVRLVLTGEAEQEPDLHALHALLAERFFAHDLRDESFPKRDLWEGAGEDSLRGLFLFKLREARDNEKDPVRRELLTKAARYGLAALDGREAWQP